jgi:4a-hydroxytetrahydrobiopterin dehydratase
VPDWQVDGTTLRRTFTFAGWPETLAFVGALGWLAHREDHHPVLTVAYRRCTAVWTTHSAGNRLSLNDFICAAHADALFAKGDA